MERERYFRDHPEERERYYREHPDEHPSIFKRATDWTREKVGGAWEGLTGRPSYYEHEMRYRPEYERRAGDAAEWAQRTAHEAGDKGRDLYGSAKDTLGQWARTAGDLYDTARYRTYETADTARARMGDVMGRVGQTAEQVAHTAGEYAAGAGHKMSEAATEAKESVVETTRSVLYHRYLWAATGFLLGLAASLLGARRYMDVRSHRLFDMQLQTNKPDLNSVSPAMRMVVLPGKEQMFVKQWMQLSDYVKNRPGFKNAMLFKPVPPSNEWLALTEFERLEDYLNVASTGEFDAMCKRIKTMAGGQPHLYQMVTEYPIKAH